MANDLKQGAETTDKFLKAVNRSADDIADGISNLTASHDFRNEHLGQDVVVGHANNSVNGLESVGNAVTRTLEAQMEQSDAGASKYQMQKLDRIIGVTDTINGAAALGSKMHIMDKMNSISQNDSTRVNAILDSAGVNTSHVNTNNLTSKVAYKGGTEDKVGFFDVARSYRDNERILNKYLDRNGIQGRSLTVRDVKNGLRNGQLGGVEISKGSDLKAILKEKQRLLELSSSVKNMKKNKFSLTQRAKNILKESAKDSDAYAGYNNVAMVGKASVTGVKTFEKTVGLGATVGGLGLEGANWIVGKNRGEKIKALEKGSKTFKKVGNAAMHEPGKTAVKKTANFARDRIKTGALIFLKFLNESRLGMIINGWGSKVVEKIGQTAFLKGLNSVFGRIMNSALMKSLAKSGKFAGGLVKGVGKVFGKVFVFFGKLKLAIIIGIAAILFFIIMTTYISTTMQGAFIALFPSSVYDSNKSHIDSKMQHAVDELWEIQMAYEENISKASSSSPKISIGIPNKWKNIQDSSCTLPEDDLLSSSLISVKILGELKGYNLTHYWGPRDIVYSGTYDETVVIGPPLKKGDPPQTQTVTYTVTLRGCAGLDGYLGVYTEQDDVLNINCNAYKNIPSNPEFEVEYKYMGSRKSEEVTASQFSRFLTTYGNYQAYCIETFYKSMVAMAISVSHNDDNESQQFLKNYMKKLFDKVFEDSTITLKSFSPVSDPTKQVSWTYNDGVTKHTITADGYTRRVKLTITLNNVGIQDMISTDRVTTEWCRANSKGYYRKKGLFAAQEEWEGWFKPDGQRSDMNDYAIMLYELKSADWKKLYNNLQLPLETAPTLTIEDIDGIIEQIKKNNGPISEAQEKFLRTSLDMVGRFYYKYAGGHPVEDVNNPPGGLDCSGFVSYALFKGGVDSTYTPRSCIGLLGSYKSSNFSGSYAGLKPGTLIIANNEAGTATTSSNHVVIYLGTFKSRGDTVPRDYCVECTTDNSTGRVISGVQLSSVYHMTQIIPGYMYTEDPF